MARLPVTLSAVLSLDPTAPAIEFHGQWRTWGRLATEARALGDALAGAGFGAGTRIGVVLRNQPEVLAALLGILIVEGCVASLNAAAPDERLAADMASLQAPVLIATEADWNRSNLLKEARATGALCLALTGEERSPLRVVCELDLLAAAHWVAQAPGIAIEMLSSGTTGTPKRIPLSLEKLEKALQGAASYEKGRAENDAPKLRSGVQIVTAPLAHIAGITGTLNNLLAGRKVCLIEKFSVSAFTDAVRRHRPKVAGAPPSAIRMILDANVPKEDLSSLVAFRTGTAPLDPDLAEAFQERYGIPVLQNYGATEFAGGAAGWTLEDFRQYWKLKRGSVGRLNPGVHARTLDPATGEVLAGSAEGLLEIRAPNIGDGKSWVRTTDLAVVDADGFLWIMGRHDGAIIRGGFKIQPDDVVRALERHPAVREAAVAALSDTRLGQVPAAGYIVRSDVQPPTEDELRAFLREHLMPYQIPVRFMQVAELPRTVSMKPNQTALRALFESQAAQTVSP